MTSLDKQLEDLITERNEFEKENRKLKAELAGYRSRVCSMCDGHGLVGNCMDSMDCPDCTKVMNSVKADAIDILGNIMEREFGGHTGSFVRLYVDKLRANN